MPARRKAVSSSSGRVHIVLVPGFAGFDALGQLEYYAGVTPQFRQWNNGGRREVVLHYFDNFPTAAVETRAELLGEYMAKRVARGEFLPEDSLALVGHSTGGLDIRKLLWDWHHDPDRAYHIDGIPRWQRAPRAGDVRAMVKRVVFLSVPQWGTNIADWVRARGPERDLLITQLRASVAASQAPVLNKLESWLTGGAAVVSKLDLLFAIEDALNEAETGLHDDSMTVALAQDAASELELYLRHIASDFKAIDDLRAAQNSRDVSPAHFSDRVREHEKKSWNGIRTQSYATLGRRAFVFKPGQPAPPWDIFSLGSYREWSKRDPHSNGTDLVYRIVYRMCAGGPFQYPYWKKPPAPKPFCGAPPERIELWDNDGIVNTASMLWPNGKDTLFVAADHMDIVGHHRRVHTLNKASKRKYDAYDLLKSHSGFGEAQFRQVWNHIFDFCSHGLV